MEYKAYNYHSFVKSPYYDLLPASEREVFNNLGHIFHFKINNYVLDFLIDWNNIPKDPIYQLTFPRKEMLSHEDYSSLKNLKKKFNLHPDKNYGKKLMEPIYQSIRSKVQPKLQTSDECFRSDAMPPASLCHNFPTLLGLFPSVMHKTCHAYCSYCFRWIAFEEVSVQRQNSYTDPKVPLSYLQSHAEITDVQFTGADPMVVNANKLREFIEPILDIESVKVVRIVTKSLAYWPFRFITDSDVDDVFELFRYIQSKGKHLSISAHFTHSRELENPAVVEAVQNIRSTGAVIRCQGPLIKGINDSVDALTDLWSRQIELGMIPYYLFIEAGHNPSHCFRLPIARSLELFQEAQKKASSLARTIRGPVFMNDEHRVLVAGITSIDNNKFFVLKSLQAPPNTLGEGDIKLVPYNEETTDLGDLAQLFEGEVTDDGLTIV